MNESQQKLLERGVVVLPDEITHEAYRYVLEALVLRPERVVLYCAGDGGDTGCALAMVDLIRQHGQVDGMLAGHAASNHVVVWAACAARYVFPYGRIGVHKLAWSSLDGRTDSETLRLWARAFDTSEASIAQVLAEAGERDTDWWLRTIQQAGSGGLIEFDAAWLVAHGLARPVAEWNGLHRSAPEPDLRGREPDNGQARFQAVVG